MHDILNGLDDNCDIVHTIATLPIRHIAKKIQVNSKALVLIT